VDGVLSEACWEVASVTSSFLAADKAGLPDEQTQVRVCWDATSMYFGVEAFDAFLAPRLNMMHLVKADRQGPAARVFSDDCVELFLQPPGETYYHFAANSGTGTYEARNQGEDWDCQWRCVAKRGSRSYVLEMAIPFAALAAQPKGNWHANFARERTAVKELSTWCGLQSAFHQPEAFGTLSFTRTGPALGEVSFSRQGRSYQFHATIGGAANELSAFQAVIKAGDDSNSATAAGPGSHAVQVGVPDGAFEAGQVEISYSLQQGKMVMLSSAPIPEALAAALATLSVHARDAEVKAFLNGAAGPTLAFLRGGPAAGLARGGVAGGVARCQAQRGGHLDAGRLEAGLLCLCHLRGRRAAAALPEARYLLPAPWQPAAYALLRPRPGKDPVRAVPHGRGGAGRAEVRRRRAGQRR
jgi:hypothetical protein